MEEKNVIYGLYCVCETCEKDRPEEIRYVGLTSRGMQVRMCEHRKEYARRGKDPLSRWKRKHGVENIRYKVLEVLPDKGLLDAAEMKWIAKLRTFRDWKEGGLNGNLGGDSNVCMAEESRERTRKANSRDGISWAKINRAIAKSMREDYLSGMTRRQVAEKYDLAYAHACDVIRNTVWIDPDYEYRDIKAVKPVDPEKPLRSLTREQAYEIRELYHGSDISYDELKEQFGVGYSVLQKVMQNRAWIDPEFTPRTRPLTEKARKNLSKATKGVKKPAGHGQKVSLAIRGANHGMAKLDEDGVRYIRSQEGLKTAKELSEELGLNPNSIARIWRRERWGWLDD